MTKIYARPVDTINTGTEHTDFGVKDSKGRAVGAQVMFTTQTMEATDPATTSGYLGYEGVKAGTYLTAWGRATRAGMPFGAITGAFARFRIADDGDEMEATRAREAWVAEYLRNAQARALKNFGK